MAGSLEMVRSMLSDRTLNVVGLFLSLTAAGGQGLYPNFYLVWVVCLTIGICGVLWTFLNWLAEAEGAVGKFSAKYKSYLLSIVLTITVVVFAKAWDTAQQLNELPDVELVLVDPKGMNVIIDNPSDKVANQPKYYIALWNLEHPERENPLPLPISKNDYILPHGSWGPTMTMGLPLVQPLVNSGDRLFGYAQVLCQDCRRVHVYLVYIIHGKEGWYYELPIDQIIGWHQLIHQLKNGSGDMEGWLDKQAPVQHRKLIKNSPYNTL